MDMAFTSFHISEWKLVASIHMKNRSSLTFVTVDILFLSYCHLFKIRFGFSLHSMLSYIWMEVGSKLPYEELMKSDIRHGWPTFQKFLPSVQSSFLDFLAYAVIYLDESWLQAFIWRVTDQVRLLSRLTIFHYCCLFKYKKRLLL